MDYSTKPDPLSCPICGRERDWSYIDGEWELDWEWWFLPGQYDFLCSKACWRKAERENYYEPKTRETSSETGIPMDARPEDLSELPTVSVRMYTYTLDEEGKTRVC